MSSSVYAIKEQSADPMLPGFGLGVVNDNPYAFVSLDQEQQQPQQPMYAHQQDETTSTTGSQHEHGHDESDDMLIITPGSAALDKRMANLTRNTSQSLFPYNSTANMSLTAPDNDRRRSESLDSSISARSNNNNNNSSNNSDRNNRPHSSPSSGSGSSSSKKYSTVKKPSKRQKVITDNEVKPSNQSFVRVCFSF